MKRLKQLTWMMGTCGLAIAMLGGCTDRQAHRQAFFPERPGEGVFAAADHQADNGARNDAMLRPMHFDGDKLNSLGQSKLDRMTCDTTCDAACDAGKSAVTVYLDLPQDAAASRRQAVVAYLHEKGLKDNQITIKQGVNPNTLSPAEDGLTRLSKTENPGSAEQQQQENQNNAAGMTQSGTVSSQ